MADKTSDPASITLELHGADITAQTFRKSVVCFFDVIDEVVRIFPLARGQVRWTVAVTSGSANIHLTAHSQNDQFGLPKIHELVGAIHEGIRIIETSAAKPPYFSDYALRKTNELASLVKGGIDSFDVKWKQQTTRLSSQSSDHIRSLLRTAYKSWGSVDGVLREISERATRKFLLYDDVTDKYIRCHFSADLLPSVLSEFGKRITAFGLISYRSDATIKSITVDHFTRFPESQAIPGFSEIYGLLSNVE